jgi:hypothetical protein
VVAHRLTIDQLAELQDCVVRRDQLTGVVTAGRLRAQLAAERWQELSRTVLALHNGPLTPSQQRWAAALAGGPAAGLGGRTALTLGGLKNWSDDQVHIVAPIGARVPALTGVPMVLHQSRTLRAEHILPSGPPRTRIPRSAVDAAAWSRSPRTAAGLLAAVVQQKLTTAELLADALAAAGPIRHAKLLRSTVCDIAGGAQAMSEIDFGRLCRDNGLGNPPRQVVRYDSTGRRRYLDALLVGPDGREVGVEIDGAHHMQTEQWDRDLDRSNELLIGGAAVLHFTSLAVRLEPQRVLRQLRAALGLA